MTRKRSRAGGGVAISMDRRRHRWRPGVAMMFASLAATMTMGVVPALVQSNASARPISDCPDLHVVAVPGTLDSSVKRDPHDQRGVMAPMIADAQRGAPAGSMQTTYVPYPADFGYTSNGTPYTQSVDAGVAATEAQIAAINRQCGSQTEIAIVGYSQGADIAGRVATDIGTGKGPVAPSRVRGVYLLSDPNREMDAELVPGAPGLSAPLNGARTKMAKSDVALGGGIGPGRGSEYGALTGRVVSMCMTGDFACAIPDNAQVVRVGANVAEQIHVDTSDPVQIGADMSAVAIRAGVLTGLHVATTPHWMYSSETLGDVVAATTNPYYEVPDYKDPAVLLRSLYGVGTFVWEFSDQWDAKLQQEAVLGVRNNSGVLLMGAHPDYWYPGPSHGSYFTHRDQNGRTGSNYVSTWLRESAVSSSPSGSVAPAAAPQQKAPTKSNRVVNAASTGVVVAEVNAEVVRQTPAVTTALTKEANNAARGTEVATQVNDVTSVIDQGAAVVEHTFGEIERIGAEVQQTVDGIGAQIVETVQPLIDAVSPVIDAVDKVVDTVEKTADTAGKLLELTQQGPGGVAQIGDLVSQIGTAEVGK